MKPGHGKRLKEIAVDLLVDHRKVLIAGVGLLTIVMAIFAPQVQRDPTIKSYFVTGAPVNLEYQRFQETFGNDEYLIVAIRPEAGARDPGFLEALESITREIRKLDKVEEVISLTDVRVFQWKNEKLGFSPVTFSHDGKPQLPEDAQLAAMRKGYAVFDLLLSEDLKTVGVLVRLHDHYRFDSPAIQSVLESIHEIISKWAPETDHRIVGPPALRLAIQKYSFRASWVFAVLCTLICISVTVYVFRSIKVTLISLGILAVCCIWVLGLMYLLSIPLIASTSMSFGIILITTLEIVIHMVTRYNQFRGSAPNKLLAVKQAVRFLIRPCLIASATTAVGFGSCMVTDMPMIFQFGFIMTVGVMISWALAMLLSPAAIMATDSLDVDVSPASSHDVLSGVLEKGKHVISRHHTITVILGFCLSAVMFAGIPYIRTDPQIVRQLSPRTPERQDLDFVESYLTPIQFIKVVVEADEDSFKKPEIWRKVRELDRKLRSVPDVVTTSSLLPALEYSYGLLKSDPSKGHELLDAPDAVAQVLFLTSRYEDGERLLRTYLDDSFGSLSITVRIKDSPSIPIGQTINRVKSVAESVMKGTARTVVTGEMVVVAVEAEGVIASEIYSMLMAIPLISALMMYQMGSVKFGLLGLVPNIPPLATVFGLMGWFGIALDRITIFAATVSLGLAVDNTIQYVNQLKREIKMNPSLGLEACVLRAYSLAGKPMLSWSLVTSLGFFSLAATPFEASIRFGTLVASAVFVGILSDLVFMQSLILSSKWARRIINNQIEKEMKAQQFDEIAP